MASTAAQTYTTTYLQFVKSWIVVRLHCLTVWHFEISRVSITSYQIYQTSMLAPTNAPSLRPLFSNKCILSPPSFFQQMHPLSALFSPTNAPSLCPLLPRKCTLFFPTNSFITHMRASWNAFFLNKYLPQPHNFPHPSQNFHLKLMQQISTWKPHLNIFIITFALD